MFRVTVPMRGELPLARVQRQVDFCFGIATRIGLPAAGCWLIMPDVFAATRYLGIDDSPSIFIVIFLVLALGIGIGFLAFLLGCEQLSYVAAARRQNSFIILAIAADNGRLIRTDGNGAETVWPAKEVSDLCVTSVCHDGGDSPNYWIADLEAVLADGSRHKLLSHSGKEGNDAEIACATMEWLAGCLKDRLGLQAQAF